MRISLLTVFALILASGTAMAADAANPFCGLSPDDWCSVPDDDPCARHPDEAACRADPACYGMPYRGESLERCKWDDRGFAPNCPAVGCTSTPPEGE